MRRNNRAFPSLSINLSSWDSSIGNGIAAQQQQQQEAEAHPAILALHPLQAPADGFHRQALGVLNGRALLPGMPISRPGVIGARPASGIVPGVGGRRQRRGFPGRRFSYSHSSF
jgi:hypothetical protein